MLTNLGRKDDQGRQVRIEHRTRYTRISRTGGVAIRAQTRAAGVNLTVNSNHGLRLSKGVLKGTQIALQKGRFRLRGRYGKGPTKINLSKSGITVSTRNQLGSFNWIKPNRSSAKLFGVQVRGKKAAQLQLYYMFFSLIYHAFVVLIKSAILLIQLALVVVQQLYRGMYLMAHWLKRQSEMYSETRRLRAVKKAQLDADNLPTELIAQLKKWTRLQQRAAIVWIIGAWGQAQTDLGTVTTWQSDAHADQLNNLAEQETLTDIAAQLNNFTALFNSQRPLQDEMRLLTWLAQRLPRTQASLDWVLDLDEWLVASQDGRSALQVSMYDRLLACLGVGVAAH